MRFILFIIFLCAVYDKGGVNLLHLFTFRTERYASFIDRLSNIKALCYQSLQ